MSLKNDYIVSANLDVFKNIEIFPVCQSVIHEVWARQHSARLETRLKYSPGNAFETFVFPEISDEIHEIGQKYHLARQKIMVDGQIGLTKLYNHFHSDTKSDLHIESLRALQREMDAAVTYAYGWDDLDLGHGFHEVSYLPENDRVRFTISESARAEVLRRLSALNRQQYERELEAGLHKAAKKPASGKKRAKPRAGDLFIADPAEMETVDD